MFIIFKLNIYVSLQVTSFSLISLIFVLVFLGTWYFYEGGFIDFGFENTIIVIKQVRGRREKLKIN